MSSFALQRQEFSQARIRIAQAAAEERATTRLRIVQATSEQTLATELGTEAVNG